MKLELTLSKDDKELEHDAFYRKFGHDPQYQNLLIIKNTIDVVVKDPVIEKEKINVVKKKATKKLIKNKD